MKRNKSNVSIVVALILVAVTIIGWVAMQFTASAFSNDQNYLPDTIEWKDYEIGGNFAELKAGCLGDTLIVVYNDSGLASVSDADVCMP